MIDQKEIRKARLALGLTQEQAGEVIGATRRAWQDWELGQRNMPRAKWELFQIKTASERKFTKDYVDMSVKNYGGIK